MDLNHLLLIIIYNMFFCCSETVSGQGYEVITNDRNKRTKKFVQNLKDISDKQKASPKVQIVKVAKSDYKSLAKKYKGKKEKWTDESFPPDDRSLGHIEGLSDVKWKRISEIIYDPVLFDSMIEPKDIIQGNLGDCYLLSALAALSENPRYIKDIFDEQAYNPNGIYAVDMRVDGEVREIIVDDYVPVNEFGQPLFCQPNKNEFWVLIVEKAWAKANKSYSNIIGKVLSMLSRQSF